MWLGQEGWAPVNTSGMNSAPGMAPLSPGLSSSPPLVPKNTNFQSLGSLSGGRFSPSLAKGFCPPARQGSSPLNSPCPSIMSSPKLWHKASVSRLAEEFFWIGGSVVAQPKWRLGQMGKIHSWLKSEPSQTHHAHFFESTKAAEVPSGDLAEHNLLQFPNLSFPREAQIDFTCRI